MSQNLTIELHNRLKEALAYDADSGVFTWRISTGRVKPGAIATSPSHGHLRVQFDGRSYWVHRLAWLFAHGEWPKGQIDHINGVRTDNRLVNLRDVSGGINQQNQRRPQAHNKTSSYLGVSWRTRAKKWRAAISLNGKMIEIGLFDSEEKASEAYLQRKRQIHEGCTI